jgi:hypothetical protein
MSPERWLSLAGPLVMHAASWPDLAGILVLLLALSAARLLAERARRKTLVQLVEGAPGGTVMMQGDGLGGPAMWVQVGAGQPRTSHGGRS